MPRLSILLALLVTAASGAVAQNATPDTLDWRGYFPLAVGNEWEYRVDYVDPADPFDPVDRSRTNYIRYRVVGDGAGPDGDRFALVEDGFSADGVGGPRDTLAVRYDEATASVLALIEPETGEPYEWPHPRFAADLDLPLGWPPEDERLTLVYTAAQRFEDGGPLPIPPAVPDSVDLNRTKWFYNLVYGFTSVHGIGFVAGGGG